MGVGDSGMGWVRSGSLMFVKAVAERWLMVCAAGGIPGTGPDISEPEVAGATDEADAWRT